MGHRRQDDSLPAGPRPGRAEPVDNYLGAKYALPLSGDATTNGNYNALSGSFRTDVLGIGRASNNSLATTSGLGGLSLGGTLSTDYAACAGDPLLPHDFSGPAMLAIAGQWTAADSWRANLQFPYSADPGGVCFIRSRITAAAIRGGLSNTYVVGEKYLNPDDYSTGRDSGDNQSMYGGYYHDYRSVRLGYQPLRDQPGRGGPENFGSTYPAGFTMTFCDGAVRHLGYDIDAEVHRGLGRRNSVAVIEGL